jgi:hypothetical protein
MLTAEAGPPLIMANRTCHLGQGPAACTKLTIPITPPVTWKGPEVPTRASLRLCHIGKRSTGPGTEDRQDCSSLLTHLQCSQPFFSRRRLPQVPTRGMATVLELGCFSPSPGDPRCVAPKTAIRETPSNPPPNVQQDVTV